MSLTARARGEAAEGGGNLRAGEVVWIRGGGEGTLRGVPTKQ